MARFYLLEAHLFGANRYRAQTTIADTVGNALPGDKVVGTMTSNTVTPSMLPLDAAATALRAASKYANVGLSATIAGNQSVDA